MISTPSLRSDSMMISAPLILFIAASPPHALRESVALAVACGIVPAIRDGRGDVRAEGPVARARGCPLPQERGPALRRGLGAPVSYGALRPGRPPGEKRTA